jgi:thiol-disulfide isomerase/thioredoxin
MAAALKAAQSLSYSVSLTGAGSIMSMLPEMKGEVTMVRSGGGGDWKLRVEGSRGAGMGSPEMTFILVGDGQKKTWIDHPTKTVFERVGGAANGEPVNVTSLLIPQQFLLAEPFSTFVTAPTIKLEDPPTTADGVKCDIVFVDLGETADKYRIAIAQTDHLPRKIQKIYAGGQDVTQTWSIKNLRTNITTSDQTWTVITPEGYKFSPNPAPAAPPMPPKAAAPGTGATPAAPAAPARSIGVNPSDLAPDFELKNQKGEAVRLSSLKGGVVVLDFWGSWCPPCKIAAPELQKLADKYKDNVKFMGLSVREQSDEAPAAFWKQQNHTYPLFLKADEVAKTYRVKNFPTFFVIGKEGEIVWTGTGWSDTVNAAKLTEAIESALAGHTPAAPKPAATDAPAQTPAMVTPLKLRSTTGAANPAGAK